MVKRKSEVQESLLKQTGKKQRFAATATKKSKKPAADTPKPSIKSALKKSKSSAATTATNGELKEQDEPLSIQIITGSYERVLHGFAATLPRHVLANATKAKSSDDEVDEDAKKPLAVSDTFLFAAHTSAVRCLALSPPTENHKRFLATGSTDERINLYNLSTAPPVVSSTKPQLPSLAQTSVVENSRNRELGSLMHHARGVSKLQFPTKGKLFSGADDCTIAISRTRDWTVLSTIKVPIPKPVGRPSGDTAGPGEVPAGVNDFAIHPSMKVMVSVGKGEKSMRLWNLVTGKKAGVLNFDRQLLEAVGEGRYSSGEARKVLWSEDGDDYVVGFERGAVVYGMDSVPKAIIRPSPPTKIHQMRFLPATHVTEGQSVLAVSTEDGRVIFYDIKKSATPSSSTKQAFASCQGIAQLGGVASGFIGRIKDFEILSVPKSGVMSSSPLLFITGSSDGAVRTWRLESSEIESATQGDGQQTQPQVGKLLGTHETGNRITCLTAFVMDGPAEGPDDQDEVVGAEDDEGSDSDTDSE